MYCVCPDPEKKIAKWNNFKATFGRKFRDLQHEYERQKIFNDELDFIKEHNEKFKKGFFTFTVGINNFSDWTLQEFLDLSKAIKLLPKEEIEEVLYY